MAPPVDRVRAYKAETAATGGTAGDNRPYPAVLNPQQDALDAAGVFMQQPGTADRDVCIWREGHTMRFADRSVPGGVTLSQLAAGGGSSEEATPWVSLMDIQPRQASTMADALASEGIVELHDDAYPAEFPYRVYASVEGLTHVRFSVVVLEMTDGWGRIWIEGSWDDGWSWMPLDTVQGPEVEITPSGGYGPNGDLYRSEPVDLLLEEHPAIWLRVMVEAPELKGQGLRLGAIRVEGMARKGV